VVDSANGSQTDHGPRVDRTFEALRSGPPIWISENSKPKRSRYLRSLSASFEIDFRAREAPKRVRPASERERVRLTVSMTYANCAIKKIDLFQLFRGEESFKLVVLRCLGLMPSHGEPAISVSRYLRFSDWTLLKCRESWIELLGSTALRLAQAITAVFL
jgi:hypothetical protein